MKKKTTILHGAAARDIQTGALSIPVYHASTYHQTDIGQQALWEYGRSANPTRHALEQVLAELEGADAGFAFSSGMAALSAALTAFVKSGDHIVATQDIYGGSYRFLTAYINKFGISHTFVDTTDLASVQRAITGATRIIFLESPSNPLLKVTDLAAMAKIARERGIISIIDNTFMSPYLQRPLDLGIDVSVHSATKFLGGHSDLIAGAVMTKSKEFSKALKFVQNCCGAVLSPGDSWLLMRGIKTLGARMDAQGISSVQLADWLTRQDWVDKVYFPGLEDHPGHEIMKKQADGFGAVVSIQTDSLERALRIMKRVQLWHVAVSLGGVESILSYPSTMSHAAIPRALREKLGITDTLLRLSVGLEDVEDLKSDLSAAAQ